MLARYHGQERLLCPHVLGWRAGRAKVLAYQAAGGTSAGKLPAEAARRWRSMFVEEVEVASVCEGAWHSAPNYAGGVGSHGMDHVEVAVAAGG